MMLPVLSRYGQDAGAQGKACKTMAAYGTFTDGNRADISQFLKPTPDKYTGILGPDGMPISSRGREPARYDELPVPTTLTFSAILGSGWRKYIADQWDAARRNSYEDSLAMERDWPGAMAQVPVLV